MILSFVILLLMALAVWFFNVYATMEVSLIVNFWVMVILIIWFLQFLRFL